MFGADRSLDTNKQKMAKSLQNSRSTTKFNLAGDENLINELIGTKNIIVNPRNGHLCKRIGINSLFHVV